jgi:hypothetical protein
VKLHASFSQVSQFRKLSQLLVKKATYVWTYSLTLGPPTRMLSFRSVSWLLNPHTKTSNLQQHLKGTSRVGPSKQSCKFLLSSHGVYNLSNITILHVIIGMFRDQFIIRGTLIGTRSIVDTHTIVVCLHDKA